MIKSSKCLLNENKDLSWHIKLHWNGNNKFSQYLKIPKSVRELWDMGDYTNLFAYWIIIHIKLTLPSPSV